MITIHKEKLSIIFTLTFVVVFALGMLAAISPVSHAQDGPDQGNDSSPNGDSSDASTSSSETEGDTADGSVRGGGGGSIIGTGYIEKNNRCVLTVSPSPVSRGNAVTVTVTRLPIPGGGAITIDSSTLYTLRPYIVFKPNPFTYKTSSLAPGKHSFSAYSSYTFCSSRALNHNDAPCNLVNTQCSSTFRVIASLPPPLLSPPLPSSPPQCSDSTDNDGDGLNNRTDPGCYNSGGYSASDNSEADVLPVCSNFFDDDEDGTHDHVSVNPGNPDLGCSSPSDSTEGSPPAILTIKAIPFPLARFDGTVEIDWTANNVNSCTVTGVNSTGTINTWTGISGTQETSSLTELTTYALQCLDLEDRPKSASVIVNILPKIIEF